MQNQYQDKCFGDSPKRLVHNNTYTDREKYDSCSQAVDGQYLSTYQERHCSMKPTSPEIFTEEFPPQRTTAKPGSGNFQVGGYGSGSSRGDINHCDRGSTNSSRVYRERDVDHFADSLRKYPRYLPDDAQEIVERLVNYSKIKDFAREPNRFNQSPQLEPCVRESSTSTAHEVINSPRMRYEELHQRDSCKEIDYPPIHRDNSGRSNRDRDVPVNFMDSDSQAAVPMISRHVSTVPRPSPTRRTIAVPLSSSSTSKLREPSKYDGCDKSVDNKQKDFKRTETKVKGSVNSSGSTVTEKTTKYKCIEIKSKSIDDMHRTSTTTTTKYKTITHVIRKSKDILQKETPHCVEVGIMTTDLVDKKIPTDNTVSEEERLIKRIEKLLKKSKHVLKKDKKVEQDSEQFVYNFNNKIPKHNADVVLKTQPKYYSQHIIEHLKEVIKLWLHNITIHDKYIINYVFDKLLPLVLDRPNAAEYKTALEYDITNILNNLPIQFSKDNKENCLNNIRDDLVNKILTIDDAIPGITAQPSIVEVMQFVNDHISLLLDKIQIYVSTRSLKVLETELFSCLQYLTKTKTADDNTINEISNIIQATINVPQDKAKYFTKIIMKDFKELFFRRNKLNNDNINSQNEVKPTTNRLKTFKEQLIEDLILPENYENIKETVIKEITSSLINEMGISQNNSINNDSKGQELECYNNDTSKKATHFVNVYTMTTVGSANKLIGQPKTSTSNESEQEYNPKQTNNNAMDEIYDEILPLKRVNSKGDSKNEDATTLANKFTHISDLVYTEKAPTDDNLCKKLENKSFDYIKSNNDENNKTETQELVTKENSICIVENNLLKIYNNNERDSGDEDNDLKANVEDWLSKLPLNITDWELFETRKKVFIKKMNLLKALGSNDGRIIREIVKYMKSLPLNMSKDFNKTRYLNEETNNLVRLRSLSAESIFLNKTIHLPIASTYDDFAKPDNDSSELQLMLDKMAEEMFNLIYPGHRQEVKPYFNNTPIIIGSLYEYNSSKTASKNAIYNENRSKIVTYGVTVNMTDVSRPQTIHSDDLESNLRAYTQQIVNRISDWFDSNILQNTDDASFKKVMMDELTEDIAERHKYLALNGQNQTNLQEEIELLNYEIFRWANKLISDVNEDTQSKVEDLMRNIQNIPKPKLTLCRINTKRDFPEIQTFIGNDDIVPYETPSRHDYSEITLLGSQCFNCQTESACTFTKDTLKISQNEKDIFKKYEMMFKRKINELFIDNSSPESEKLTDFVISTIFNAIHTTFFNQNSEFENECEHFELVLDKILDLLPQTPMMKKNRSTWKLDILTLGFSILKEIQASNDEPSFKKRFRDEINTKLADNMDLGQFLIQQDLITKMANAYILHMNYKGVDPRRANIYKLKLIEKMNEMVNHYARYNGKFRLVDKSTLLQQVMQTLESVSLPKEHILKTEVKEILLTEEIERWYAELPIKPFHNEYDQVFTRKLIDSLAKKLNEIENYKSSRDNSKERLIKYEISKYILQNGRLEKDQNSNINTMVNELYNRIKRLLNNSKNYQEFDKKHKNKPSTMFVNSNNNDILPLTLHAPICVEQSKGRQMRRYSNVSKCVQRQIASQVHNGQSPIRPETAKNFKIKSNLPVRSTSTSPVRKVIDKQIGQKEGEVEPKKISFRNMSPKNRVQSCKMLQSSVPKVKIGQTRSKTASINYQTSTSRTTNLKNDTSIEMCNILPRSTDRGTSFPLRTIYQTSRATSPVKTIQAKEKNQRESIQTIFSLPRKVRKPRQSRLERVNEVLFAQSHQNTRQVPDTPQSSPFSTETESPGESEGQEKYKPKYKAKDFDTRGCKERCHGRCVCDDIPCPMFAKICWYYCD